MRSASLAIIAVVLFASGLAVCEEDYVLVDLVLPSACGTVTSEAYTAVTCLGASLLGASGEAATLDAPGAGRSLGSPGLPAGSEGQDSERSPFGLTCNYPNPFKSTTRIRFSVPGACYESRYVRITVSDVVGRVVSVVLDGHLSPGPHEVVWPGRDSGGSEVSSGIYFVHVRSGDCFATKRMILLR